jgi:uncharacterized membrane protein YhhN
MQIDPQQHNANGSGWLSLLFVSAAAVSAVWVAGSRGWFPAWHGFPNTASTTLFFLAAAATANRGVPTRYKWGVVAGLGFSAMGDAFLMLQGDYFVAGLASFLAAHLCYLWGFTHDSRLAGRKLPFLVWGLWGIVLVPLLWPGLPGSLRIPVVLYAVALLTMAAQAASRATSRRDAAAILAAVGAGLFVVSDSVLAFQRFRHPLEWGRLLVLGTYFAAQGGIALSVVLHRDRAACNKL